MAKEKFLGHAGACMTGFWHNSTLSAASLSVCSQCQEYVFEQAGSPTLFAEFIAVAHRNQSSVVNDADAVGHFLGHAQLMRGDEHGHAFD
jgi:hypothetical protein